MSRSLCLVPAICLVVIAGCATSPKSDEGKAKLQADAQKTIDQAKKSDPTIAPFFQNSVGYAVFPSVAKGAVGVGGAGGKGVLYEHGQPVGYCRLTQATIGLQLGGQSYSEILFFEKPSNLQDFKSGNFAFSAQATAVALKSGAGANAKYQNGVAVFTLGESGLMYEASIGGQKFSYEPTAATE